MRGKQNVHHEKRLKDMFYNPVRLVLKDDSVKQLEQLKIRLDLRQEEKKDGK